MVRLYLKYFAINIKSQMQYKTAFFLHLFGRIMLSFATVAGVWFMFLRFNRVEGFTLNQVLLCTAVTMMSYSITEVFARGFDIFPRLLGNGEFDRYLVRPRGVIYQVIATHMEFGRLGVFIQAVIVFCYAIPNSGIVWSPDKILTLFLMIICGAAVFSGLYIIFASFSFFTVEGLEFMNILTHGGKEFGRYPYAIYGEGILKFLTFIIPLALFQYYPLLYLIERESSPLYILTPLLSMFFLVPCYVFWKIGLRHYKSTGS
ncbi:MAG: ABC-2 family transporter protein [Oscillospiraceae bacterium]|nr:ABC-2 family transporter protein [Oscillospiraceae bacterium]